MVAFHRIAVLGATGATGRTLVADLVARGEAVRVVARNQARLQILFAETGAECRAGDALDEAALGAALDGCDVVVDCIGTVGSRMGDHPVTAANLARVAKAGGARVVQVSSYWCYMPLTGAPVSEAHPRQGGAPWARLRREAEDILLAAGAAIVHLPDFFGPMVQFSTLQLPLQDAARGRAMNWIGSAKVERDYIYVPDAMAIVADLMGREAAYGEHWVVPGSGPISGREIGAIAADILERKVSVRQAPTLVLRAMALFNRDMGGLIELLPEYRKPLSYDGGKLETLVGRPQRTSYREAIGETLHWLARPRQD
jgi:nucleoside-diphosphate-sugar epimerase